MSQEKLQTMVMQKFWGIIEVYYGIVQVVNCADSRYESFEFFGKGLYKLYSRFRFPSPGSKGLVFWGYQG